MKTVNFDVTEVWTVECPECGREQPAPFNKENPMSPMETECDYCDIRFILTYERD